MIIYRRRSRSRKRRRTLRRYLRLTPGIGNVPVGTVSPVRRSLHHRLCLTPASSVNFNRCLFYLYWGNPSNVVYQGNNYDNSLIAYNGNPYPYEYPVYYRFYKQMVYLGMKYKATWYRDVETATKLDTTVCYVGYVDAPVCNASLVNWPWDAGNIIKTWDDPAGQFKVCRAVPTNATSSVLCSLSGNITARKLWRQPTNRDRFKVPTVTPGKANTTVPQINQGVGTAAVGAVCFQQFFPDLVAPANQQWSQLWLELQHDIYFFDPYPVPLP